MHGKILLLLAAMALPAMGQVYVPGAGSTEWRFNAGTTETKNWQAADFDDSSWEKGAGPVATLSGRGIGTTFKAPAAEEGKAVVTKFRHQFEVPEENAKEGKLSLSLKFTETATVFLNGREVLKLSSVPEEEGGRGTRVNAARHTINATLQKGTNTLAVAVTSPAGEAPKVFFDASLRVDKGSPIGSAKLTESARTATMAYYKQHYIGPDMTVPDGYVDGGRRMVIGKDNKVASTREILVIDRSKDETLRKRLAVAKDPELLKLPTAERAKKLAEYVDKALSPNGDRSGALQAVEEFTEQYANRPVMFGEMEEACQSGVCRHRALLFKMLCDDAGLKSALVRGNYRSSQSSGGHAWNELLLDDGSRVIVDVMNPLPDFKFLAEDAPQARHYVSVRDEPLYPRKEAEKTP